MVVLGLWCEPLVVSEANDLDLKDGWKEGGGRKEVEGREEGRTEERKE